MAAQRASPSFLDTLRASGLLDAARLAELARCPEARDPSPTPLARAVFQRGWLTRFQLNMVAAGRGKELIVGPYALLDRLGEGGMGMVYKARHQHMQRVVALKVIRKEKLGSPEAVKRFYQEAQLAAALQHPNIVLAYDAGPAGSNHYFAMEFVEGIDLARLVKEQGRLPVPQACDYVRQAALGLQHAHERGMVHRDVKPANLLVSRAAATSDVAASPNAAAARGDVVKLLDMGLARLQGGGDTGMTRLGAVIGTPDYIAPEQALNSKSADIRADLYSLGCSLYYLLTGRPPFTGNELTEVLLQHQMEQAAPLSERGVQAPEGVQAILDTLMAKRPEDRYQTPAELIKVLTPFCREGTLAASTFDFRSEADSSDQWGSLTLDDAKEKGAGRPSNKQGTKELSRTSAGTRETRRKRGEAEAAKRRSRLLLMGVAGVGALLVLPLLAGVFYLALGRSGPEPLARRRTRPRRSGGGRPPRPTRASPSHPPTGAASRFSHRTAASRSSHRTAASRSSPPIPPPAYGPLVGPVAKLALPTEPVMSAAFSPDGKRLAVGGFKLRLWDLGRDKELHDFGGTSYRAVNALAWSADGRRLLMGGVPLGGGNPGVAVLFEADTGKVVQTFTGHPTSVSAVALSPDGRHVLTGAGALKMADGKPVRGPDNRFVWEDTEVRRWEVATGKELRRYRGPTSPVAALGFAADGKGFCAVGGIMDSAAFAWDVDREDGRRVPLGKGAQNQAAVSADGREVACIGSDRAWHVYDLKEGQERCHSEKLAGFLTRLAWSRDGRYIACGTMKPQKEPGTAPIYLADAATGKVVRAFEGHPNMVGALALSDDGRLVFSHSADGARLWEREKASTAESPTPAPEKPLFVGHDGSVLAVAFSADGKKLLSGGKDQTVRVWDVATGEELKKLSGLVTAPSRVAFAARGKEAVATSLGSGFVSWEIETGKILKSAGFAAHSADALSADGEQFFVPLAKGFVQVQKTGDSGGAARSVRGQWGTVVAATFAPDGHRVYFVSGDGLLHEAHFQLEKEVGKGWLVSKGEVICLAVHPKVTHIALASDDKSVTLWKLPTAQVPAGRAYACKGHKDKVNCLAFAPDGMHFVTGGADATIRVWDLQGTAVAKSTEHKEAVQGVAFSPDGKWVVSCGDGIKLWEWEKKLPKP